MIVELALDTIDAGRLIEHVTKPSKGGVCTFHGVVRNNADGRRVEKLVYAAYESMALAQMKAIVDAVLVRWESCEVALVHRTGELQIGEASIVIAVGAPHRAEAFAACRYIIERVKTTVPIWKKEYFDDGSVWVEPAAFQPIVE